MGDTESQTIAQTMSKTPAGYDWLTRSLGSALSGGSSDKPGASGVAPMLQYNSLDPQGTAKMLDYMRGVSMGDWSNPKSAENQEVFKAWQGQANKTVDTGINNIASRLTKVGQNASSSALGQLSRQVISDANSTLLGKMADYQQAARDQQLKAAGGVTSLDLLPYELAVKATQATNPGSSQISTTTGSNPLFGSK